MKSEKVIRGRKRTSRAEEGEPGGKLRRGPSKIMHENVKMKLITLHIHF